MSMSRELCIHDALTKKLNLDVLIIENESRYHKNMPNAETHFKIVAISSQFEDLSRIERHRLIHDLLKTEFKNGLHALTLSLYTPTEWEKRDQKTTHSPPCQHSQHPAKKLKSQKDAET